MTFLGLKLTSGFVGDFRNVFFSQTQSWTIVAHFEEKLKSKYLNFLNKQTFYVGDLEVLGKFFWIFWDELDLKGFGNFVSYFISILFPN